MQEEKAMAAVPQYPIEVQKFVAYVQERKKKRILFKGELLVSQFFKRTAVFAYAANLFILLISSVHCRQLNTITMIDSHFLVWRVDFPTVMLTEKGRSLPVNALSVKIFEKLVLYIGKAFLERILLPFRFL